MLQSDARGLDEVILCIQKSDFRCALKVNKRPGGEVREEFGVYLASCIHPHGRPHLGSLSAWQGGRSSSRGYSCPITLHCIQYSPWASSLWATMQKINTLIIKPQRETGMLRQRPHCASLAETRAGAYSIYQMHTSCFLHLSLLLVFSVSLGMFGGVVWCAMTPWWSGLPVTFTCFFLGNDSLANQGARKRE